MIINSISKQNFKGYDAIPLKALYINTGARDPIYWELDKISQQENIEVKSIGGLIKWNQDHRTIIEKNNKPLMLQSWRADLDTQNRIRKFCDIPQKTANNYIEGGNCFIGKLFNGEKWMLIGEDETGHESLTQFAKEYDIKKKNIFSIPQQYYHLDMFIRPIGYPFVLVDNPDLVKEKFKKLNTNGEFSELEKEFKNFEKNRKENYQNHKKTISALKKAGFIPIEIAGNYGSGINFINAVVNKHQDGKISYITNSSKTYDGIATKLQEEFENDLKEKFPDVDKVYFISGPLQKNANFMMDQLNMFGGGFHCLIAEEPNFEIWG